jgi:hypothetical protein
MPAIVRMPIVWATNVRTIVSRWIVADRRWRIADVIAAHVARCGSVTEANADPCAAAISVAIVPVRGADPDADADSGARGLGS